MGRRGMVVWPGVGPGGVGESLRRDRRSPRLTHVGYLLRAAQRDRVEVEVLAELRLHPHLTHHPLLHPKMTLQLGGLAKRSREKTDSARKKRKRRSRSGDRRRIKEADAVTLLTLPNVVGFRSWKLAVRSAVVAASGRGDEAFKWIMEVEGENVKHEDLAVSGKKFVNLDWKLKSCP